MSPRPTESPVRGFSRQNRGELNRAQEDRIISGDLESPTLDKDVFKTLFKLTGTRVEAFAPGFGSPNDQFAMGWADLNLKDDASTPVEIDGELRWVLYASDALEAPIYKSGKILLQNLRSAVSEARKDKVLLEGLSPATDQDRVLILECRAKDAANELTVSPANSAEDLGIPYTRFQA